MFMPAAVDPPHIHEALWHGFTPGGTVAYDVGSNGGQTFPDIKKLASTIVAFEPEQSSFGYLRLRHSDDLGVVLVNEAVSSVDGTIELMSLPDKISTGQLVTAGTKGMEWSGDLDTGTPVIVSSVTLDTYAAATEAYPSFIKIDVEGHELEVLRGAPEVLARRPEMLIEVHSFDLGKDIYHLLKHDFRLEEVRHPYYASASELWRSHFWFRVFPK